MTRKAVLAFIVVLACLSPCGAADKSPQVADDCRLVRAQIEARRADLGQCVESLVRAQTQDDLIGMAALSEKITRLIEEIRELDARPECGQDGARNSHGLGPVKSDPGAFESKSCSELQQLRVKFLMTVNALKRRERSKFSQLSTSEQEELDRAEADLKSIKGVIAAKCVQEKAPPLRQYLRSPTRSRDDLRR